ncbi:MAG: hypothetical protein U0U67_02185 [Chitinophagales bacterium]
METIGIIGMIMMVLGLANAAWVGIWFLIALSARAGTNLSKKLGTANERTDEYAEQGRSFSNDLLVKLISRLAIALIGFLMYHFTK